MEIIREACVETKQEFDIAYKNKAERIELCSRLDVGGYTPDEQLVDYATSLDNSNIIIMIRRKSDSFVTNEADMAQLIADVDKYSESKVRGFVFGLLTSDNKVDQKNVATLVKHAKDKYTVFSMAFDLIEDQFEAIDQLANLGVKRILTKGGSGVAMDNIHKLNKLKEYAKGKIELVVGGKVSDDNYLIINEKTGINQFQGRKLAAKS